VRDYEKYLNNIYVILDNGLSRPGHLGFVKKAMIRHTETRVALKEIINIDPPEDLKLI